MGETDTSFALVGTEYLIISILQLVETVVGEQDDHEGFCGLTFCFGVVGCALRGPGKGGGTFQGHIILDARRQSTGSLKVKLELCQASSRPRM